MVDKYPGRFDIEVLRDMPPHGYILSYLVGPIILICNLDVLKNATLSVLSGEGPRKGEVVHLIMDPNPLRQLVPFLFF